MLSAKLSTPVNLRGDIYRGVGGTSDYNELENKPSINGDVLEGDISLWQPFNFATTETDTGFKWIDGSPIYVRVFEGQISGSTCTFNLDFNIKYATALCNIYNNNYWVWDEQYMYCLISHNYIEITKKVSSAYGSNNLCKMILFYVKEN